MFDGTLLGQSALFFVVIGKASANECKRACASESTAIHTGTFIIFQLPDSDKSHPVGVAVFAGKDLQYPSQKQQQGSCDFG